MLYGIGGFIMLSLSDQNYRAVTQQAPKILIYRFVVMCGRDWHF